MNHYEKLIIVSDDDIDELGHVNNIVYLRWVQQIATEHWRRDAPPEDQEILVWVVRRHEIDYKKPAFKSDEILAHTWVGKAKKLQFERYSEFKRKSDGVVLALAKTIWVPISKKTGKPTFVSDEVRRLFSVS